MHNLNNDYLIFTRPDCEPCKKLKAKFNARSIPFDELCLKERKNIPKLLKLFPDVDENKDHAPFLFKIQNGNYERVILGKDIE